MNFFYNLLGSFLIFSMVFVGDFSVQSFPVYFIVWFCVIFYRVIFNLKFEGNEFILQSVFVFVFFPYFINMIVSDSLYYLFLVYVILFVNVVPVYSSIYRSSIASNFHFLLLVFFALGAFFFGEERSGFVFGPNVLYRVLGYFYLFYLMASISKPKSRVYLSHFWVFTAFCFLSIGIFATGSRGGMLVWVISLLITLGAYGFFKFNFRLLLVIAVPCLFLSFFELDFSFLGRLIYFDVNNGSESVRISLLNQFLLYFDGLDFKRYLIGLGDLNYLYPIAGKYPHNIIIELIVYNGIVFFTFFVVCFLFSAFQLIKREDGRFLLVVMSPILIGTLLSGSMIDNYAVFFVLIYCVLNSKFIKSNG